MKIINFLPVLLLSLADAEGKSAKAAKKPKKSKGEGAAPKPIAKPTSKPTSKPTHAPTKVCPADAQEAAAMGAKVWGDLWLDVVTVPNCDREGITQVWLNYLADEAVVDADPALFGGPASPDYPNVADQRLCEGREACAQFLPSGTTFNCEYKNFLTFSSHSAEVDPHDCNKFTVLMNEYVTYPEGGCEFGVPTGRVYGFTLNHMEEGPYAKLNYIRFNCPWDLKNTLVPCLGANTTYDPMYKIDGGFDKPDVCFPME